VAPGLAAFPQRAEISAGAKSAPRACNDHHADALISAMRPSASLTAIASSLFSAFNRSGRFITNAAMPSRFSSRMTGPAS